MPTVAFEYHHCQNREKGPVPLDETFLGQLVAMAALPVADRDMRITEDAELKRSCFLEDARLSNNNVLLGVLSFARFDYRPPVINVDTKARRPNPKNDNEGEEAKTHFALRASDGLLIIQSNRDGASARVLRQYINEKWEQLNGGKVGFKTGVRLDPNKVNTLMNQRVTAIKLLTQLRPNDDDTVLGQLHRHAPGVFDTAANSEVVLKVDRGHQFPADSVRQMIASWKNRQVAGLYLRASDDGASPKWFNLDKLKYVHKEDVQPDPLADGLARDRIYVLMGSFSRGSHMFRILDSLLSLYRRARFSEEIWWESRVPLIFAILVAIYLVLRVGHLPWLSELKFEAFKDVFNGVLYFFAIAVAFNLAMVTIMASSSSSTIFSKVSSDVVKGIEHNGLTWGQFINMRLILATVHGAAAIGMSMLALLLLAIKPLWNLQTGWLELIFIAVLVWSTSSSMIMTGKNIMYMYLLLTPDQRS